MLGPWQGLAAAQLAATLRGGMQAMLGQGATPSAVMAFLSDQTEADGKLVACLDVKFSTLSIMGCGDWRILHWSKANQAATWLPMPGGPSTGEPSCERSLDITLGPGDRVALITEALFDVLNRERKRFCQAELEALLRDSDLTCAAEIVESLSGRVKAFAGKECLDEDIAAFVLVRRPDDGSA